MTACVLSCSDSNRAVTVHVLEKLYMNLVMAAINHRLSDVKLV